MTNDQLEAEFTKTVREERRVTNQLLILLREIEKRRLHLERGYSNLYKLLVVGHGYSQSAANRRIQAMRLLRDIPEMAQKLEVGEVTLTTLAQTQSTLRREEKRTGKKIDLKFKQELVQKIEKQTEDQTRQVLAEIFPEVSQTSESLRAINATESRMTLILDAETVELLKMAKDQLSHSLPNGSWAEVIKRSLRELVERRKPSSPRKSGPVSRREMKRQVFERAGYQCEYIDPRTKHRCEETARLEEDHIIPKALGGTDEVENLRCLCKSHNLLMAERNLGVARMEKYWPRRE